MKTVLFNCPQMGGLARKIYDSFQDIIMGKCNWGKFPDGFPNLEIEASLVDGADVVFLASFDTPEDIFAQLGVIYSIPRYHARSLKVILSYFPTGTMDRVNQEGEIATAMTLARMLSAIPPCHGRGPAEVVIFDIHALQERFYFSDQVIPRLESGIDLLRKSLFDQGMTDVAIAFPDAGAYKRFGTQLSDFPQIVCEKVRIGDERKITIVDGDPEDRDVVLVDDLVLSGNTLLAAGEALDEAGARSLRAYVTHAVCPEEAWQKFLGGPFSTFMITDSCPITAQQVEGTDKFKVLSLAPKIIDIIKKGARQ